MRAVPAHATLELRGRVLRDGRPHEGFPEDELPSTLHLAAEDDDGRTVGVATFLDHGEGVWQLRGMAVDGDAQGLGVGRTVLEAGFDAVRGRGGRRLWANARDTALGFYERLGFRVVGEGYLLSGRPHHRIELDL